jgi:plastocyanin
VETDESVNIRQPDRTEYPVMKDIVHEQIGSVGEYRGRDRRRTGALTVGLLIALALGLAACSSGGTTAPVTSAAGGRSPATTDTIAIANFAFAPALLTVAPGATVTVVNHDQVAHTVTATGGAFRTGNISPGASVTFTAPNHAGTFPYICSIHQYMSGTLTVS